jgi:hypothetical protein
MWERAAEPGPGVVVDIDDIGPSFGTVLVAVAAP